MSEDKTMRQLTQAARLLGSSTAVIVHRMPHPERLLAAAGSIWTPERDWQLVATVLWVQRGQEKPSRPSAWRDWLRWLWRGGHR